VPGRVPAALADVRSILAGSPDVCRHDCPVEAGEVLTSQETTEETEDPFVRFERSRTAHLKGVANPMTLYRAVRGS